MKIIAGLFLAAGIFVLMQTILPILSFQFWAMGQNLNGQDLADPGGKASVLGVSVQDKDNFPAFISSTRTLERPFERFYLSVPKLKIQKASVFVDSNDLSKGLAHLPGSPLPGEKGNVFISGHSAIRPSFSIKEALFSNLINLKPGDKIVIDTPNASFTYEVVSFKLVDPSNLSVINPPEKEGRYISLMTCVPPGLNFKRLIVLGKMI